MQTLTHDSDRTSSDGQAPRSWADGDACLRRILLDLMLSRSALPWPGADGVTVEEVLAAYVPASEEGRAPGEADLIRRHPELAVEIRSFFALDGEPPAFCGPHRIG